GRPRRGGRAGARRRALRSTGVSLGGGGLHGGGCGGAGGAPGDRAARPRPPLASGAAGADRFGDGPARPPRSREAGALDVRSGVAAGDGDRRSRSGAESLAGAADRAGPSTGRSESAAGGPGALAGPAAGGGAGGGGGVGAGAPAGGFGDLPLRGARPAAIAGRHLAQRRGWPRVGGFFPPPPPPRVHPGGGPPRGGPTPAPA